MKTGIKGEACTYVNSENTAAAMKSGTLDVFATPAVAALIEQACQESVSGELGADETTVGTYICIEHIAATAAGKKVHAERLSLLILITESFCLKASVYDRGKAD